MDQQQHAPLTRPKKLVFAAILIFLVWVILDVTTYVALLQFSKAHPIFFKYDVPSREQLSAFYERMFHPVWGWDIPKDRQNNLGARAGRTYPERDRYKIKLFGDSFVYSDEVENHEAFAHLIEAETGWDALNFGVVGYGTDQALLKYNDTRIKSEYTILGILDENIARCGNIWQGFYHIGDQLYWPKPRYVVDENGQVTLLENPATTRSELMRLADEQFVKSLEKYDYWANYYERLNAPRRLVWPASVVLLPHADFFLKQCSLYVQRGLHRTYENELKVSRVLPLYEDDGLFAIMRYIIDEFVRKANEREEVPIVLLFQTDRSTELTLRYKRKPHQRLADYLEARNTHHIDVSDAIATKDYSQYFVERRPGDTRGRHYSLKGNQVVARLVVDFITALETERLSLRSSPLGRS